MNIGKKLVDALRAKTKPSAYDTSAIVKRIEGQTAWVSISGGVDETPVKISIDAKPGDNVNVRVAGGKAWITGNNTAPPTDDKKANEVERQLKSNNKQVTYAVKEADAASKKATEAQTSADGKSTIWYTQSAPTEGMSEGDTWFNPTEGNAIYQYNGTAWVKKELGTDAIENLAITNAKIGNLDAGKITSGTIDTLRLNVPEIITAGSIATDEDLADKADAADAVDEEQLVYKSAVSGTTSMQKPSAWVTDVTGSQATWTTKRPPYSSTYPVLFVAKQKKTVSGSVTCTTPHIDDTLTVIDGGHITTGTIDADRVSAGSFTMTGGSIDIETSSESTDKIKLSGNGYSTKQAPRGYNVHSESRAGSTYVRDVDIYSDHISLSDKAWGATYKRKDIYIDLSTHKIVLRTFNTSTGAVTSQTELSADGLAVNSKSLLDMTYPVGAIYMSTVNTSPATLFGGTWVAIEDRFLLAYGPNHNPAGTTGGEETVTLTAAQSGLRAHTHSFTQPSVDVELQLAKDAASGTAKNRVTSQNASSPDAHTTYTQTASGGAVGAVTGGAQSATSAHNNMPPYLVVYMWKRTA